MKSISREKSLAEAASWYAAVSLLALLLVLSCCRCWWWCCMSSGGGETTAAELENTDRDSVVSDRPCDDIYVVGEGETLQTIIEKCGDPYIVEKNPHIHDPDEVFPGLVIKITPFING